MTAREQAERDAILARLVESRAEIRRLLEPPAEGAQAQHSDEDSDLGDFPRSRTLRMLLSGKSLSTVGATVAGLLLARPGLAWRLLRALPAGPLARLILSRLMGGRKARNP